MNAHHHHRSPRPAASVAHASTLLRKSPHRPPTRARLAPQAVPCLLALAFALPALPVESPAQSKKREPLVLLRHKATKFKVKAPKGFKLRHKTGFYRLKRKKERVTIAKIRSVLDNRTVAAGMMNTGGLSKARLKKTGGGHYVTGFYKRFRVLIVVKGNSPEYTVTKYTLPKRESRKRTARRARPLRLADVRSLSRFARTARGGAVAPLVPAVPLRPFAQGGASAQVPNLPGWTHNGAGGALSGGNINQGNYSLGIGTPYGPASPFPTSGGVFAVDAVEQIWGPLNGATVTDVALIPGSSGSLGPSYNGGSGTFLVRYVRQGRAHEGIFLVGTSYDPFAGFGIFYHSQVSVRVGLPPGIGQALMTTWSTWDPRPANRARLATTLANLRGLPGTPHGVFDAAHQGYTDLIRF